MRRNLSWKNILYVLFSAFLLNPACVKYYVDGFKEDVFVVSSDWRRIMSNSEQVFVNSHKELEVIFHDEKWSGASYYFPFYAPNGIYEISVTARAEKKEGRISLYGYTKDYTSNLTLGERVVPVSEEYKEYSFNVRMPGQDYIIDLFLTKDDAEAKEGRLFIKNLKIYYKLVNLTSTENHIENKNNNCFPPYRKWSRWQASEEQAFINTDNVMELRFNEKKWTSAHYHLPFYKGNGKIILKYTVRAIKQKGRLQVYDYTAKKVLTYMVINDSKDFENYTVKFKNPQDEGHAVWIRFMQDNPKVTGGSLLIKKAQINNKILDISL